MSQLARDPLERLSVEELVGSYRKGEAKAVNVTAAYLSRIDALDGKIATYEHLDHEAALEQAAAIDAAMARGVDPGPLAGIPVAIKDIVAVDGMPTHHGSRIDVSDLVSEEGAFVKRLREAGAVILGKVKTVEFAFGAVGLSTTRGMPHNPFDATTKRITGGSSSGSAVAMAAGMCAFSIGSDTGASVRLPAALNGVPGQKTTVGLWPTDGVFPLSPTLDSLGTFAPTIEDLAYLFHAIGKDAPLAPPPLAGLRFGVPRDYFFENLEAPVARAVEACLDALRDAGCHLIPITLDGTQERREVFRDIVASEVLSALGHERFDAGRAGMDQTVAGRIAAGYEVDGWQYLRASRRRRELERMTNEKLAHLDGVITPVNTMLAKPETDFDSPEKATEIALEITRCTQPMNLYNLCGVTMPIQHLTGEKLPIGIQIMGPAGHDRRMLSIGQAVEALIGRGPRPDLSGFTT